MFRTWDHIIWLRADGEYAECERLLRGLIKQFPQVTRLRAGLANSLREEGRVPSALKVCEEAMAAGTPDMFLRRAYARALAAARRWQEAVDQFTAVLMEAPRDFDALSGIGVAFASLGEYDRAREYLLRAHDVQPTNATIVHALGLTAMRQNKLTEARYYFEQALRLDPNLIPAQRDLARVRQALKP